MAGFPVPLDNLITYVKTLHPGSGPLENVTDAFTVSEQLGDQADALIGYFVDQARRSGASWSQIGQAMGVSKQAAQKRFVAGRLPDNVDFSRLTDRGRNVIAAAAELAAAEGEEAIRAAHLTAALLVEPYGLAARIFTVAGLTAEQVYEAVGTGPAALSKNWSASSLREIKFTEGAAAALKDALRTALRLGHNYIGTEHILLGLLHADERIRQVLAELGLTPQRAEELFTTEMAAFRARRETDGD